MVTAERCRRQSERMPLHMFAASEIVFDLGILSPILTVPVREKLPSDMVVSVNPYFTSFTTDPSIGFTPEVSVTLPLILISCEKLIKTKNRTADIDFCKVINPPFVYG